MNHSNHPNQITPNTQGMQGQAGVGQVAAGQVQDLQAQGATSQMPGLQQVQQQVASLRETLQELMHDKQYADGEIMTASATLDAQLEDYYRRLSDKKQPSMRTF